ncbi:MAG: NF038129 family PEP-CTERM protein [Acidobacteriaceae bacterium]|nr:NF038129 family PEP-CTERM protein [Acidobacteriaceae bacterium]
MRRINHRLTLISAGILALSALSSGAFAQSTGYLVTVNTNSVQGQQGTIDLQFNAGALTTQNACVTISNFSTDGSLQTPSSTNGSVTGTLGTSLTINNGNGGCTSGTTYSASTLNEYSQPITFGTTLSFYVTFAGPGVTNPAGNNNGNSGSSFGVAFTSGGSAALTGDPSNFAGTIALNPDGTLTPADLAGPGNTSSLVTIQAAELVTVGTSPTGLSFSVDSTSYSASQTFPWVIGSQHTLTTTSPQAGSTGTEYIFNQWSDNTTSTTDNITVSTGTTSYTAQFNTYYLLTTSVSPSATDGSVGASSTATPVSGYYPSGSQVTLTATANTGYNFSNWTGTTNSSTNPLQVTMSGPVTETANFVTNTVNVTIGTSPSGRSVSVDGGAPQTAPVHATWQVGSNHTISTSSPQGTGGTEYIFSGWSDGTTSTTDSVTASASVTSYTASFGTYYLLTTAASPSADGSVGASSSSTPVNGYYPSGAQVTLTATTSGAAYKFSNWTGTKSSSTNPLVVTMTGPTSETANFVANNISVTIATSPASGPLVSVDGGAAQAGPIHVTWVGGSQHTISTTTPQNGPGTIYQFTQWLPDNGAISHTVTAPATNVTYTAVFSVHYLLTASVSPTGAGTTQPGTAGPYYAPGTVVTMTAMPNAGYNFQNWTGPVANANSASTTVTMNGPETVTANFTEGPTTLTGSLSGKTGALSSRVWNFYTSNSGPGAANNAEITSLTFTQTAGPSCTPTVTTPLPVVLGNYAPSGVKYTNVTINFGSCSAAARFSASARLTANQGAVTGTITVPSQAP